jgi:hypothetical protein
MLARPLPLNFVKLAILGVAALPTTSPIVCPPGCDKILRPTLANSKNLALLDASLSGFNCS